MSWEKIDSLVHSEIIKQIIRTGNGPNISDLSETINEPQSAIQISLHRLAKNHSLVLHPSSDEVWVAHPFSLSPTATWVESSNLGWWAPCMWCAFGIAALVDRDVKIHSRIGGESEAIEVQIRDGNLVENYLWVHFSQPPREAWANVHHFCACVLPFKNSQDIHSWSERHGLPVGKAITVQQLYDLAKLWYGKHKDKDWVKWNVPEAQGIFNSAGLTESFWKLEPSNGRF